MVLVHFSELLSLDMSPGLPAQTHLALKSLHTLLGFLCTNFSAQNSGLGILSLSGIPFMTPVRAHSAESPSSLRAGYHGDLIGLSLIEHLPTPFALHIDIDTYSSNVSVD